MMTAPFEGMFQPQGPGPGFTRSRADHVEQFSNKQLTGLYEMIRELQARVEALEVIKSSIL